MRNSKLVVFLSLPLAFVALAALAVQAFAADGHPTAGGVSEPLSPLGKDWKPPLKAASDEGERAMVKFKLAPGLKVSLWAAEPMLGNPNAICTDEKGRIYVAETYRYRGGVLDIRDFLTGPRAMLEQDIASRSVEDRVAFVRKTLGAEADKLAVDQDRITLIEDVDGDGKADKSTVFSDGYNRIEDGLGSGVFAYKGNVYYTCVPCLWLLKDTNNDGKADQRTCLQYGYGVRYAYIGHDLHGMVLGPDGKLYFSMGDRGLNVTKSVDDSTVENPESGAVLRCNLDGTGLELFATGLRNPQELRFDQYGNLFTGDNNPDKGDPARWVYVVEGGDSGWRIGYQHAEKPRDGGPWMAEQIWQTEEYNNAHYIVPHLSHVGAGPSGLAYYPGTGLPDRYQDTFFMCEFRGGSGNSGVWAIKNKPKGAGFVPVSVDGKPLNKDSDLARNSLIHGILVTDIEFANDGGAYLSDWTEGWERPMKGRIYRVFDEKAAKTPLVMETKKLINEGLGGKSVGDLVELFSHPDMRVRQEAQFALAAKGPEAARALATAARSKEQTLPRLHAIWGLGQVVAKAPESVSLDALVPLLNDKDLEVRCQAAKVLGEGKAQKAYGELVNLLKDPEPRARFFAAMALGKLGKKEAVAPIFTVLKESADKDGHLRHACVQALAWIGEAEPLVEAAKHESPSVRLGAALALRKMQHGDVAAFLQDTDRVVLLEAARAIHDLPIDFAMEQLAAVADQALPKEKGFAEKPVGFTPATTGGVNDWILWRATNANYRLGTPEAAQRLARLAAKDGVPVAIRVEALRDLGDWDTPPGRDRLTNLWRPLPAGRDAKAARDAAAGVVEELAKDSDTPNAVRVAATNLMRQLGLGDPATLAATVEDAKASPEVRVAALASLVASKNQQFMMKAVEAALKDKDPTLRREATRALASVPGGVKRITDLLERGSVQDKQAALAALGTSPGAEADPLLAQWMDKLIAGQVQPELQLDVLEAAEARGAPAVKEKLVQHKSAVRDPKDPLSYFRETLAGGDAEVGKRIFRENAAVSCMRCHSAEGEGGIVGPNLNGLATRQNREYILESIVSPNAKIAEGFETVVVQTKETPPRYRTGVLKKEDDKELVLMNPDAEADQQVMTIPKNSIANRERGPSAMPEGLVKALTKRELRDLVEYLANRKEPAK